MRQDFTACPGLLPAFAYTVFPELTRFACRFKLRGYTLGPMWFVPHLTDAGIIPTVS